MIEPANRTVSIDITFSVTNPASMRAAALEHFLAGGGSEKTFIENERDEDRVADTPVGFWLFEILDLSREFGPGFECNMHEVDINRFYVPPPLPEGFDPATSVSGSRIAKLMKIALESERWSDAKPRLPRRFRSLVTNPAWYADPGLYESTRPWYFEISNHEYAGVDAARNVGSSAEVIYKIGRADIIAALADLAENRPRRIVEIMNDQIDLDLADIFFQTVVFKEHCYLYFPAEQ